MKSHNTFFLLTIVGLGIIANPQIGDARTKKASTVQQTMSNKAISMESFRAGSLDRLSIRTLAENSLAAGKFQDAGELFDKLVVWYPNDEKILRQATRTYLELKNAEKTISLYAKLVRQHPKDPHLNLEAARAYKWTGRFAEAQKLYAVGVDAGVASDVVINEYAEVLLIEKQYIKATARYQELLEKNKIKRESAVNAVYKLADASEYAEAEKLLTAIEKRFPGDTQALQAKANIALRKNDFPEARKISSQILQQAPDNEEAILISAEMASWEDKNYELALAEYDKLINQNKSGNKSYFKEIAYREKARVLGWLAKYTHALATYDEAIKMDPKNKALQAEAKAKREYFRGSYRLAVKAYKEWLAVEPKQQEALFDLGQMYMQANQWQKAAETYDQLLANAPEHRQAAMAKDKTTLYASNPIVTTGAEYLKVTAKYSEKDVSYSYSGFYTSLSYPFKENLSGLLSINNKYYDFENGGSVNKQSITAGVEYKNLPDGLIRAAYTFNKNPQGVSDKHTGFIEAESEPLNNVHINAAFRREEVMDNARSFQQNITRDQWKGRVLYTGYRAWHVGADYVSADYSDGNTGITKGADITAHLISGLRELNLSYRLQDYGFSDIKGMLHDRYWTPNSFTTHTAKIDGRYYFNKERFNGVNNTYVTTAYQASFEPEGNIAHQVHAGLHHDWSNRLSTILEGQYTWATEVDYQDKLLKAQLQWFF